MNSRIKKFIILNLPYLVFVWAFDKAGQAFRLAGGADLSAKILDLGTGFAKAFESMAPSFHGTDLLVGIAGAAAVRLMVYFRGKNAKKYRQGVEYGSARWGTAADIAPYMDQEFDNNVLLTMTERLTMFSRPKEPKYARNKNILVIGEGVIIGLSQATSRKRGPQRLSPILVTGGEHNGAGFSVYIIIRNLSLLKGSARYPSYQIRRNFYMAFKNTRNITVISQNGHNYKPTPTIMLKGQWLRAAGFEIGDHIKVECEDGKLVILLDREKEKEIEAERVFMEEETKKLKARFEAEKKEIHARFVAERKAGYGA